MSASRPKLLLFDLDETLLGPTRCVSPANAEALRAAMDEGIRVGFATGRSKRSVQPWIEELKPNAPLILLNGGMVWDVGSGRALCAHRLPSEDVRATLAILDELGVHANVYLGDEIAIARRSETSRQSERKDGVPHRVVADLATHVSAQLEPPLKILCIRESSEIEELADRLRPALTGGSVLVRSEVTYLEVLPPGVSKGAALPVVLEHCGILASEVFSFGDSLNDLELLAASGVGVAMGNAHPRVREIADCVIGSNDSDSIADFLTLRAGLVSGSSFERG